MPMKSDSREQQKNEDIDMNDNPFKFIKASFDRHSKAAKEESGDSGIPEPAGAADLVVLDRNSQERDHKDNKKRNLSEPLEKVSDYEAVQTWTPNF